MTVVWGEIKIAQNRSFLVFSIDSSRILSVGIVSELCLVQVELCFFAAKFQLDAGHNSYAQAAPVITEVGWVGSVGYGHVLIPSLRRPDY